MTGIHRMSQPIHLILKFPSAKVTLGEAFIWDTNIFPLFLIQRGLSIKLIEFYPDLITNFLVM